MSRRGIAAIGLRNAIRHRFTDGQEHTVAEVVTAVAHLIPPEIAARRYRHDAPSAPWPPDDYADALYHGQRSMVVQHLRQVGATWGPRPHRLARIETFTLLGARDIEPSASTQRERREMVAALLESEILSAKSDQAIARQCGVSDSTVLRIRRRLSSSFEEDRRRVAERNGVTFEMRTANIGRTKRAKQSDDAGVTMTVPITIDGALAVLRRLSSAEAQAAVDAWIDGRD